MAAAVASRSNAGKAALAAGGVVVAGYGAYYLSNLSQVKALEKEKDGLATKSFVAKGKFKRAENDILESESLIKALQQQTELDSRTITAIAQELEAARLKVQQCWHGSFKAFWLYSITCSPSCTPGKQQHPCRCRSCHSLYSNYAVLGQNLCDKQERQICMLSGKTGRQM